MVFDRSRVVIIGGGAIGTSIAYHLARAGERDVLLLEKAQLTHGSTWHAAGLVGQLRSKKNLTRLMQNSVAVFDRLEEETGQSIDWRKSGSLRVASSAARMTEIRRSLSKRKDLDSKPMKSRLKRRRAASPGCRSTASSAPHGFLRTAT